MKVIILARVFEPDKQRKPLFTRLTLLDTKDRSGHSLLLEMQIIHRAAAALKSIREIRSSSPGLFRRNGLVQTELGYDS